MTSTTVATNTRNWVALLSIPFLAVACSGRGNVDLSKATPLTAEPVTTPNAGTGTAPLSPLFQYAPGTWLSMKAVGGAIDPVGTSLAEDFDGDGIRNDKELTSNIWIADYPVVDSQIAPPVTMKIEILKTTGTGSSTIDSNLTSDNFESRKNEGSEKFHQDEVNLKTINNGTTTDTSNSTTTKELKASVGGAIISKMLPIPLPVPDLSGGISTTTSSTNTTTRQTFEDRPFVNNIDRQALSTKSDAAEKNARDYRREKRQKADQDFATKSDGGIIRAALYIKNQSVNMPVRLSNILCSLVFETPAGALIPMQSFRLRNDDFSLFEVEVYGNTEFGPYVVELRNLNTVEIENAIAYGYTPKVFIVDYKMTHVQDSSYRAALSNSFTGDNLKIIEENAKGRTALLKLIYSDYRNMFRITAFDANLTSTGTDICNQAHIDTASATSVSPGLPMHKFLDRVKCSGVDVQFGHFVYDMTGMPNAGLYPKVYTYAVKSVNNRSVTAPCSSMDTGTGYNPATGTYGTVNNVCVIKMKDLTEAQLENLNIWAIFDNGKIYAPGDFVKDAGGAMISFDGVSLTTCGQVGQVCGTAVAKGIASTVWAGDNYDLVQLRIADFLGLQRKFGTNPIETGSLVNLNTKWDIPAMGDYPFDPTTRAVFLGKAGLGDTIELTFNLKDTKLLNPNWGTDLDPSSNFAFNNFQYNLATSTRKYTVEEAIDFEINFGLGGQTSDWYNVLRSPTFTIVNKSLDYINQKFTVQITLPTTLNYSPPDGLVSLYLRPTPNNAYRNSVWPQSYQLVNKFSSTVKIAAIVGASSVALESGSGILATGDTIVFAGDTTTYTVNSDSLVGTTRTIGISPPLTAALAVGVKGGVNANLPGPTTRLVIDSVSTSDSVFTAYNTLNPTAKLLVNNLTIDPTGSVTSLDCIANPQWFTPGKCLGQINDYLISNWVGNSAFTNNFTDASRLSAITADTQAATVDILRPTPSRALYVASADIQSYTAPDTLLSTVGSNNMNVRMAVSNGRAIVVWETSGTSNPDIRGRVFDINTGAPVGAEFPISTTNGGAQTYVRVAADNGKAFVVWQSNDLDTGIFTNPTVTDYEIRGRMLDMTSAVPAPIGTEIPIAVAGFNFPSTTVSSQPEIIATNGKVVIVWAQFDYTITFNVPPANPIASSGHQIRGAVYDLGTNQFTNTGFTINSAGNLYKFYQPSIGVYGSDKVIVAYDISAYGNDSVYGTADNPGSFINLGYLPPIRYNDTICMDIVNLNSTSISGHLCPSISYTTPAQILEQPRINVQGDRALVAWMVSGWSGGQYYAGRTIDLLSNAYVGVEQRLATSNGGDQGNLNLIPYNGKIMGVWHTTHSGPNDIRANFWDLSLLTQTSTDFLISTSNTNSQRFPRVAAQNGKAFIIWESDDDGVTYDIRGRIYDLATNTFLGNDMVISTTNGNTQSTPFIAASGSKMLTAWHSFDNLSDYQVRSRLFDLSILQALPYGPNHFFTAPLIERNFEARAKIVK